MAEEKDALNLVVRIVLLEYQISVDHMGVEKDALNLVVRMVLLENQISV